MFPLLVNGLPRSGTTILMHALAGHPQIIAHENYPYETRYAIWVWQNFKVLSQPQTEPGHHWSFQHHENYAEKNPFYMKEDLIEYFDGRFVEFLKEGAKKQVDDFYLYLAERNAKQNPFYFLEKFPGVSRNLLQAQYDQYREIYILRNPIDIYLSLKRMNIKRGRVGLDFQEDKFPQPKDHIKSLIESSLVNVELKQQSSEIFLVRYEEFVECPAKVLKGVFSFLGISCDDSSIALCDERAKDKSFVNKHSTSKKILKDNASSESADLELQTEILNQEMLEIVAFVQQESRKDMDALGYSVES
jgi:Sulfotransferase family